MKMTREFARRRGFAMNGMAQKLNHSMLDFHAFLRAIDGVMKERKLSDTAINEMLVILLAANESQRRWKLVELILFLGMTADLEDARETRSKRKR
jgi:hypothetical protein